MVKGKKPIPIAKRKQSAGDGGSRKKRKKEKDKNLDYKDSKGVTTTEKPWSCASIVHKQAAEILGKLLEADESKKGGENLKSLTLAPHIKAKKATHAVVCQTLKYLPILRPILKSTALVESHPKVHAVIVDLFRSLGNVRCIVDKRLWNSVIETLRHSVACVLLYEVLFGQGCRPQGPAERAFLKSKETLETALQELMESKGVKDANGLLPGACIAEKWPRYARVNRLKSSVGKISRQLKQEFDCEVDGMLPDVLKFPPGTDLHKHALVNNAELILQGYGSCLPAHALNPQPGWVVLDACAAPGNKTTHLASIMNGTGKILALDKDAHRAERLKANCAKAGAANVTVKNVDFLSLDPNDPELSKVQGILLDPSCSGSGTYFSRMEHLLPSAYEEGRQNAEREQERIDRLAVFQLNALKHALSFPNVQRVVYSTCSILTEENEGVVKNCLPYATEQGFKLKDPFPPWHRRGFPKFPECSKLIRTSAEEDLMDGFFVAVFEKSNMES